MAKTHCGIILALQSHFIFSRDFAKKYQLNRFFDEKDMGIEHALLPEKGLIVPDGCHRVNLFYRHYNFSLQFYHNIKRMLY